MVLLGIWAVWKIQDIVLAIFISLLVAGILYPLTEWAKRHKIPKSLAVIVAYLLLLGVIGLVILLLVPALQEQINSLLSTHGAAGDWLSQGINSIRTLLDQLKRNVSAGLQGFPWNIQQTSQIIRQIFGAVTNVFGGIVGFFIVLVLSFYFVMEDSAMKDLFRNIVPQEYQEISAQVASQVMTKLGGWLRGQLVLCVIIGLLYFIAFKIIGVPYALLLAILGGLLEFVPYLGPFLSAIPALILAFSDSPFRALITLIVIVIIQQLENNVIVPKIMQRAIGLNPIISILAFLIGAQLFGVVGAIFAIPVAMACSVAFTELLRFRRERAR